MQMKPSGRPSIPRGSLLRFCAKSAPGSFGRRRILVDHFDGMGCYQEVIVPLGVGDDPARAERPAGTFIPGVSLRQDRNALSVVEILIGGAGPPRRDEDTSYIRRVRRDAAIT